MLQECSALVSDGQASCFCIFRPSGRGISAGGTCGLRPFLRIDEAQQSITRSGGSWNSGHDHRSGDAVAGRLRRTGRKAWGTDKTLLHLRWTDGENQATPCLPSNHNNLLPRVGNKGRLGRTDRHEHPQLRHIAALRRQQRGTGEVAWTPGKANLTTTHRGVPASPLRWRGVAALQPG